MAVTKRDIDNLNEGQEKLTEKISEFIEQYELDMRGNKKLGNGEKGMVNEIRDIKEYHADYPSITWLLKNRTSKTIATICGSGLAIFSVGFIFLIVFGPSELAEFILKSLGISI